MNLVLIRTEKWLSYTKGELYVNGKFFCNTIEAADRNLDASQDLLRILLNKRNGITAIPTGTYKVNKNLLIELVPGFNKVCFLHNSKEDYNGNIIIGDNNLQLDEDNILTIRY